MKTLQARKGSGVNQEEIICEEDQRRGSFKVLPERIPSLARKLRSQEGTRSGMEGGVDPIVSQDERHHIFEKEKDEEEDKGDIVQFDAMGRVSKLCKEEELTSKPDHGSDQDLIE